MTAFIVRMKGDGAYYGPFATSGEAGDFAQFVSREIDPAFVEPLRNPTCELLAYWRSRSGIDEECPF